MTNETQAQEAIQDAAAQHTYSNLEPAKQHDVITVDQATEVARPQSSQELGHFDSMIERAMFDREFDLDRMERLITMRDTEIQRQAKIAFNDAMASCQQQMQSVVASQVNTHTKSLYAALDDIHVTCKPIWTAHGFSVTGRPETSEKQNHVRVVLTISHALGHEETFAHDWPLDLAGAQGTSNKTPIQATGSTLTYARRYSECLLFDIAIAKQDQDGNSPAQIEKQPAGAQKITRKQQDKLRENMKKASMSIIEFCQKANIQELSELEQGRLKGANEMLEKRAIKKGKK